METELSYFRNAMCCMQLARKVDLNFDAFLGHFSGKWTQWLLLQLVPSIIRNGTAVRR